MTPEQYTILINEIKDDPKGLGYSGQSNAWILSKLNDVGGSLETMPRLSVTSEQILGALISEELFLLNSTQIAILNLITSAPSVNLSDINTQNIIKGLFADGTTTRINLLALATRSVSRAEKLGLPALKLYQIENAMKEVN